MPPGATLAPPDEATQESQVHAAAAGIHKTIPLAAATERRPLVVGTPHAHAWLNEALLENSDTRPKSLVKDTFFSFFLHALIICTALLIPLYFTEAIDMRAFSQTMLVAPPPPPPPPPPAAPAIVKAPRAPNRVFQVEGKLIAPTVIPSQVAMLKEKAEDLPPDVGGYGVAGGVPGGVPGGQIGGVIGGIIGSGPRTMTPNAPPAPPVRAPIRVGGRVSPPRLLVSPDPLYPPLAKQARIDGDVQIDAVIDARGNVVEMQVLSGHPLLIPNAIAALRQWKYQPTILNDEAVPVKLLVTIRFRLQ